MNKKELLIIIALLLIFINQSLASIQLKSSTVDELRYLLTQEEITRKFQWRSWNSVQHPPLNYYLYGFILDRYSFSDVYKKLRYARKIMLIYGLALGFYVYKWARELYGSRAGLLALFLFSFDPNIIAHSNLITNDITITTTFFVTLYYIWRTFRTRSYKYPIIAGVFFGLAWLSKYTASFLIPVILIAAILNIFKSTEKVVKERIKYMALSLILIFFISFFILNLGYVFSGSFMPLKNYKFVSNFFSSLQNSSLIGFIPAPFPYPYLKGFDIQKYITENGYPTFFIGTHAINNKWYFHPVAILIKTPVPLILFFLFGLIFHKSAPQPKKFIGLFLLIPISIYIFFFSFVNKGAVNYREILPILPFVFVFSGIVVETKVSRSIKKVIYTAFYFILGWYAVGTISIYPHYLSYFNELIGGPKNGHNYLLESNFDWGQNEGLAQEYLKKSGLHFWPFKGYYPATGRFLIGSMKLHDYLGVEDEYRWMRHFKPTGNIGYTHFIYEISLDDFVNWANKEPLSAYAKFALASVLQERGHYGRAIEHLQEAIRLDPNFAEAYNLAGLIYLDSGDMGKGYAMFLAAAVASPFFSEAFDNIALVHSMRGNKTDMLRYGKMAMIANIMKYSLVKVPVEKSYHQRRLKESPREIKSRFNLGFLFWMENRLDRAIYEFYIALLIDPVFPHIYAHLSRIYEEIGLYERAGRLLQIYEALEPLADSYRVLNFRYQMRYLTVGDFFLMRSPEKDILRLKYALQMRGRTAENLNALANEYISLMLKDGIYTRIGYTGQAYQYLTEAIMADGNYLPAQINMAKLLGLKRLYKTAEGFSQQALKQNPEWISFRFVLGDIYALQRNYGKAEAQYREIIRHFPGNQAAMKRIEALRKMK